MYDEPLSPEKLPEFNRPMPVDTQGVHANFPFRARSHVAVYEDRGHKGFKLVGYDRSPWDVIRAKIRQLLMEGLLYSDSSGNWTNNSISITADNGVAYPFQTTRSNNVTYGQYNTGGNGTKLKYGSGSTLPADNDADIQAQLGNDITPTISYNNTTFTCTMSGSEVYGGSNTTINEVACFAGLNTNSSNRWVLTDHSAVSQAVTTGQTVSITYEWGF